MLTINTVQTGRLHGRLQLWYENGQLQTEELYHKGRLHGIQRAWYPSGQIKKEVSFINGAFEGIRREWYLNGQLKLECSYKRNKLDGQMMEWQSTGQLKERGSYLEGKCHGIWKEFDDKSRLVSCQLYILGFRLAGRIERFLQKGRLKAKHIARIRNTTVRRICLREIGYERFLMDFNYEIVDQDEHNSLVKVLWHPQEEPLYLVKVRCPSTGAFYTLRVPPGVKTIQSAVAWTFALGQEEYQPEEET